MNKETTEETKKVLENIKKEILLFKVDDEHNFCIQASNHTIDIVLNIINEYL